MQICCSPRRLQIIAQRTMEPPAPSAPSRVRLQPCRRVHCCSAASRAPCEAPVERKAKLTPSLRLSLFKRGRTRKPTHRCNNASELTSAAKLCDTTHGIPQRRLNDRRNRSHLTRTVPSPQPQLHSASSPGTAPMWNQRDGPGAASNHDTGPPNNLVTNLIYLEVYILWKLG